MDQPKNDIQQQQLLDYLSGKLSPEHRADFERQLKDDDFLQDAAEGLTGMQDKDAIPAVVNSLNKHLRNQIKQNKGRRRKRDIRSFPWTYIAVLLILALAGVAFFVIRYFNGR